MGKKVYRFPVKNFIGNNCSWPGRVYPKELWADINSETDWVGEFVFDKQSIYEEVKRAVDRKIKMLHIIYGV